MYSKAEIVKLKHEFWISFGRYIALHPNSEGTKINWVNYHTGHKHLFFRMDAGKNNATIYILINHPDPILREFYFERFSGFRAIIHNSLREEWNWEDGTADEYGKVISKIGTELKGVNIFDKNTWPDIISFLKPRIIALDELWNDIKDAFEDLR